MTAATLAAVALETRLLTILDYMAEGSRPPGFCPVCATAAADRCGECAQLEHDFAVINAAIGKVQQAEDDTAALAVYMKTVMHLTGIFPGSAAVLAATRGER